MRSNLPGGIIPLVIVLGVVSLASAYHFAQANYREASHKLQVAQAEIARHKATIAILNSEIVAVNKAFTFRKQKEQDILEASEHLKSAIEEVVTHEKEAKEWGNTRIPDSIVRVLNKN